MRPGPRPQPTAAKIARGNPGKENLDDRLKREPRPPEGEITPPDWLQGDSLDKWHEILPIVQGMKVMTSADVDALARYCTLHEMLVRSLASVREEGLTLLVNEATGRRAPHPAVGIARGLSSDLLRLGNEFGLTPAARTGVHADNFETADSVRKWLDDNSLQSYAASRDNFHESRFYRGGPAVSDQDGTEELNHA